MQVGRSGATFSHRATDLPVYAFVPAAFLGLVACVPVYFRVLQWYLGPRFFDLLDRPDRSRVPMSLRQEMQIAPGLVWTIAIITTVLNLAAFDTVLQVTDRQFRYSTFFSPLTHEYPIGAVQELAIYSRRVAPNGNIGNRNFLEVRLNDGSSVDTFYLIEPEHIAQVVDAFQKNPEFNGRVTRIEGYK